MLGQKRKQNIIASVNNIEKATVDIIRQSIVSGKPRLLTIRTSKIFTYLRDIERETTSIKRAIYRGENNKNPSSKRRPSATRAG